MAYVTPSTVTAGTSPITAAAHNIIVNDIIDHESRILTGGLNIVTPTSVSGSGVSLSGSKVVLTAASAPIINGCFTSTYANYRILVDITSGTAANYSLQYCLAGTPVVTGYTGEIWYRSGASIAGATNPSGSGLYLASVPAVGSVDIFGPQSTRNPKLSTSRMLQGPNIVDIVTNLSVATQFDGMGLIVNTGNVTGSITIYGYHI